LFVFALEPLQNDFVSVQGDVEFVKSDGKRGFQQLNEGRVSVDENQQDQADESSDDQGNQTQDSGETSSTEENGTGSENDQ